MKNKLIDCGLVTMDENIEKNIILRYSVPFNLVPKLGTRLHSSMENEMEIILYRYFFKHLYKNANKDLFLNINNDPRSLLNYFYDLPYKNVMFCYSLSNLEHGSIEESYTDFLNYCKMLTSVRDSYNGIIGSYGGYEDKKYFYSQVDLDRYGEIFLFNDIKINYDMNYSKYNDMEYVLECNLGINISEVCVIDYFLEKNKKYKTLIRDKNIDEILYDN